MSSSGSQTILIVDDTPANLRLLAGALASEGYRVRAFPSGDLALRAVQEEVPDLALLDINMPGMNGYELCERFRASDALREVPVLFISAMQDTEAKLTAFEKGGLDYITKPFRLEEVSARVKTHLELRVLRQQLEEQNEELARSVEKQKRLTGQLERESRGRIESQQYFVEHLARLDGLARLTALCAKNDTEDGLLRDCAQVAERITGAEHAELLLYDEPGERFRRNPLHSKQLAEAPSWVPAAKVPWVQRALHEGKQLIKDSDTEDGLWASQLQGLGFQSAVAVPVMAGTRVLGVLLAASRFSRQFDSASQSTIQEFAGTVGANLGLFRALRVLEADLDTADSVITSVLPVAVSDRLRGGESEIADRVALAGVFFCDLAGFTAYSAVTEPEEVIRMLQETFGLLETACVECGVEKIKTIGDAFMAVSGVSVAVDDPVGSIAEFALAAKAVLSEHLERIDIGVGFRVGIHAGPVIAGVLGSDRLFFDIWGDTVNFASRLESSAAHGEVRCSDALRRALGERFRFADCGMIPLKGKGEQQVWALLGQAEEAGSGELGE